MPNLVFSDDGILCRGPTLADANFTASYLPIETIVSPEGPSGTYAEKDSVYDVYSAATVDTGAQISCATIVGPVQEFRFESKDTDKALVDSNGTVTRHNSDGTVAILIHGHWLTRRLDIPVARTGGATSNQLSTFATGSLAKNVKDAMDARLIDGKEFGLFTTANHAGSVYVRNPNCFAYGIANIACVSPYNSSGANKQGATLITRRHFVTAQHFQISLGATVRWVRDDGSVVDRTITAAHQIPGTDICIETLCSDVPVDLPIAKVLPTDWRTKVGDNNTAPENGVQFTTRVPVITFNQFSQVHVAELFFTQHLSYDEVVVNTPILPGYVVWYTPTIPNDSGQPCMMFVNDELAVLLCWEHAGDGPDIAKSISAINTYISPYSVTTVDLSSFSDY